LKISGIWENAEEYGVTYKFMDSVWKLLLLLLLLLLLAISKKTIDVHGHII
jgi:hypothetical protein